MRVLRTFLLIDVFLLASVMTCRLAPPATPQNSCVPSGLMRVGSYPVKVDATTPAGIPVDTSGARVDLADIDRRVLAVATCFGRVPSVGCPVIKIAPVTHPSCVGPYELLDIVAPGYGCTEKGQEGSAACPCRWRVAIQLDGSILVPPDLYNLGDALARSDDAVNDPWVNPAIAKCALAGVGLAGMGIVP